MQDYTQLGLAGVTLGILFFIVKFFVEELREGRRERTAKDQQVAMMVQGFNETINAHIAMRNESAKRETQVLHSLSSSIEKLPNLIVEGITRVYPPTVYKEGEQAYKKILKRRG